MFATKPMLSNADKTEGKKKEDKRSRWFASYKHHKEQRTKNKVKSIFASRLFLLTKNKHGSSESTLLFLPLGEGLEFFFHLFVSLYEKI